jgi:hypothetical protein
VGGYYLFRHARETPFWADEWVWVLTRRGGGAGAFLEPNNGHLSLIPVLLYRVLFATAGLDHRGPYAVLGVGAHLGVVALVFAYAWRRVGGLLAFLAGTLMLLFGPGWENILWPFQIAWLLSIGTGIAALLMLDRRDRLGDVCASVLLMVSLASSSVGIAIAVGLVVDVAWGRRRLRDIWIFALPIACYALWSLAYQNSQLSQGDLLLVPAFVGNAAAAAVGALAGLGNHAVPDDGSSPWGRPLAVAAALLLIWRLRGLRPVPPRVLTLLAMVSSFWVLTALGRAVWGPTAAFSSRYVYTGGVLLVVLIVELARGVSVRPTTALVLTGVVAFATVSNIQEMRNGASYLVHVSQQTQADLAALDIARPAVPGDYPAKEFPAFPLTIVQAAPYFAAERDLGTPAASPARLKTMPPDARAITDRELIGIYAPALSSRAGRVGGPAPVVDLAQGGTVARSPSCVAFRIAPLTPPSTAPMLQVTLPRSGALVRSDGGATTVGLRRYGDAFQPLGSVTPGSAATLRIAADAAPDPWHLRLAADQDVTACSLG